MNCYPPVTASARLLPSSSGTTCAATDDTGAAPSSSATDNRQRTAALATASVTASSSSSGVNAFKIQPRSDGAGTRTIDSLLQSTISPLSLERRNNDTAGTAARSKKNKNSGGDGSSDEDSNNSSSSKRQRVRMNNDDDNMKKKNQQQLQQSCVLDQDGYLPDDGDGMDDRGSWDERDGDSVGDYFSADQQDGDDDDGDDEEETDGDENMVDEREGDDEQDENDDDDMMMLATSGEGGGSGGAVLDDSILLRIPALIENCGHQRGGSTASAEQRRLEEGLSSVSVETLTNCLQPVMRGLEALDACALLQQRRRPQQPQQTSSSSSGRNGATSRGAIVGNGYVLFLSRSGSFSCAYRLCCFFAFEHTDRRPCPRCMLPNICIDALWLLCYVQNPHPPNSRRSDAASCGPATRNAPEHQHRPVPAPERSPEPVLDGGLHLPAPRQDSVARPPRNVRPVQDFVRRRAPAVAGPGSRW